ncbi:arginyl-tRNA synthetase [Thermocatellispora tengchongensis]|uniref:Arginyl-tRNA synthetase n=1 Tax=Thermocatellispora tengchongensis TaxID=1073253 RepID=A0A840PGD5_9ACTN|nr:anticodon-binding protein [Thermocatellispora tengchongensis]MBB5138049.1 arginyl-tRNA synthetase [Thermocatellispora tengchongensis]
MTSIRLLAGVLGGPPAPRGSWEREAVYVAHAPDAAAAERVRALPGVTEVRARPGGMLEIVAGVPGALVPELLDPVAARPRPSPWPDRPRTWANPGFAVRYAHARAAWAERWARELGVPVDGPFEPGELSGRHDRAVLRVLAEVPGRREGGDPAPPAYLVRLATAYHDAHEHAPAHPVGDAPVLPVHTARVWQARAVRAVLAAGLAAIGETPPDRL